MEILNPSTTLPFTMMEDDFILPEDDSWNIPSPKQSFVHFSSTDDSSESAGSLQVTITTQTTKKSTKKRKLHIEDNPRAQFYLPRIPRRDIRRQYALMFANAYNSHDYHMMKHYTDTFFTPDITIFFRKFFGDSLKKEAECKGADRSLMLWQETLTNVPDMVFSLLKTQIKVRSDGTAVVSASYKITGTKVVSSNVPSGALYDELNQQLNPMREIIHDCPPSVAQGCPVENFLNENPASPSTTATNTSHPTTTDFENEFADALLDYLEEDLTINSQSSAVIVSPRPVLQQTLVVQPVESIGHFALHLDAESRVFYLDYTVNDPQQ